jgi:alpha-glucosidase
MFHKPEAERGSMQQNQKLVKDWWHGSVFYHIYPRSFYDTNDDGIGDLRGIIEKLDYLAGSEDSLGVNAIWLSPFYPSPMADFGYDVCDYRGVDGVFGDMSDFDELIDQAHKRDIRVIIDFVPNHTSSEHPWFLESKKSKNSPKRDWYIWRDGREDGPPNNWLSVFGGSGWEYDKNTGQYYLHTFLKEQPDLNWDNPEVREAMKDNMRFWLDKGVDGFRVDAVSWLSKDHQLRDEPLNPNYREEVDDPYKKLLHSFSAEGDNLFKYLNEMVEVCTQYGERFMITESYPETDDEISHYIKYYDMLDYTVCAPFNFECITFPWDAPTYRGFIDLFQEALLPGQPPIYNMGNHDKSRLATRIGRDAARAAAVLLLTLPGIPFIYYGDEIGMLDTKITPDEYKDPFAQEGASRDPERTPMQWDNSDYAGFSAKQPWLPVSDDHQKYNVASEQTDPSSFLSLYKALLKLRRGSDALKHGAYRSLDLGSDVYGFVREFDLERYTMVLNFSDKEKVINSRAIKGKVILSSKMDYGEPPLMKNELLLRPNEALVLLAAS